MYTALIETNKLQEKKLFPPFHLTVVLNPIGYYKLYTTNHQQNFTK